MRDLSWFERGRGATSKEVLALQSELGVTFPPDVAIFLEKHAGASNPMESEFPIHDPLGHYTTGNLGAVLDVHKGSIDGVRAAINEIDGLSANVVPLIATGDGNYVCLHYQTNCPSVVFYLHGRPRSANMIFLAKAFSQFLESLEVPEDDRDSL